jgi:UDP-N-acetylglucosamine--N-acetylmuramyl-(pentapeptide) pyrophosphoryl-undecaprenol N-acetylglucosamine transferase
VSRPTVLIAGGGTGGHVFPGLAVADAMRALADVDVVFGGSPRGIEKDVVPARGYRLELLDVAPIKGGGLSRAVSGAWTAARATLRALSLVRGLRPAAVLSVGGVAERQNQSTATLIVLQAIPIAAWDALEQ